VRVRFSRQDRDFMARALALAEEGRGYTEPNPMVGAVVVKDGVVVGEGATRPYGGSHAEVVALEAATQPTAGTTMYVTLEPCAHHGKTPPCAPRLVEAGIGRVVVAALDPTEKTRGRGVEVLTRAGVRVDVGLLREEAVRLNAGFYKVSATGRPLVIAKWAMTADGKTAASSGDSRWISGRESREAAHRLRGVVDCVVVGRRTATMDDPLLTCRLSECRRVAWRLVLCGTRAPALDSNLVKTAADAPVLLAFCEDRPPPGLAELVRRGCEALPLPSGPGSSARVDLLSLLDRLGQRGMTNVLVEGGALVLGSFFDARAVDRVVVFVAMSVLGGGGATAAVLGTGVPCVAEALPILEPETRASGPDLVLEGWVTDPLQYAP
jgi:diaminohydroxyphosphoribosylaminopyrimidine deaminase/5-amino-6-(5-phosphoribosylamino)uracil reductase